MSDRLDLNWRSPGSISSRYMRELKDVNVLNGPIGAGKTRTNFSKAIKLAARQKQSTLDGLRKFKLCTVHANYRQLWRSTLPSWFKLLPKESGDWTGAVDGPAKHITTFRLPDGSDVLLQVDFIAIGDNAAEDVMRGYEPTAFFLNELDLLNEDVYTFARGRVGRYPDMSEGGPSWYGILADCNAPELSSWLYQNIFQKERELSDVLLLRQPSALSPLAENVTNLPPGYYTKQMSGQPAWYIARMIKNIPGYSRDGKPIYSEWNDEIHLAREVLEPIAGLPLRLGLDGGGSPALVVTQRLMDGRWRILGELCAEQGTGPKRFGRDAARFLHNRYPDFDMVCWADPATSYGGDKQEEESTWLEIFAAESGLDVRPAPTNSPTARWEAVRLPLTRLVDGMPGVELSSDCQVLHEGFNSGYRFRKLQVPGATRYSEEADKNKFSHPHDALQYVMLSEGEDLAIRGRKDERERAVRMQRPVVNDWDPYSGEAL